jgi:hypothetical protein
MLCVWLADGVINLQERTQLQELRRVHGGQLFPRLETDGSVVVLLQPGLQQVKKTAARMARTVAPSRFEPKLLVGWSTLRGVIGKSASNYR